MYALGIQNVISSWVAMYTEIYYKDYHADLVAQKKITWELQTLV